MIHFMIIFVQNDVFYFFIFRQGHQKMKDLSLYGMHAFRIFKLNYFGLHQLLYAFNSGKKIYKFLFYVKWLNFFNFEFLVFSFFQKPNLLLVSSSSSLGTLTNGRDGPPPRWEEGTSRLPPWLSSLPTHVNCNSFQSLTKNLCDLKISNLVKLFFTSNLYIL